MNYSQRPNPTGFGYLPSSAPLANPYVPFQCENPKLYETAMGLVRGTMYPDLDLPFLNMENTCPLPPSNRGELQALKFAIQELALYLDTHDQDRKALTLYRNYQELYQQALKRYEMQCGPMNHGTPCNSNNYKWLSDPWPWEYSK